MFGAAQSWQTPVVEYCVPLQLSQAVPAASGPCPAWQGSGSGSGILQQHRLEHSQRKTNLMSTVLL